MSTAYKTPSNEKCEMSILSKLFIAGLAIAAIVDFVYSLYPNVIRSIDPMLAVVAVLVIVVISTVVALAKIQKWSGSKAFPKDWHLNPADDRQSLLTSPYFWLAMLIFALQVVFLYFYH